MLQIMANPERTELASADSNKSGFQTTTWPSSLVRDTLNLRLTAVKTQTETKLEKIKRAFSRKFAEDHDDPESDPDDLESRFELVISI